MLCCVFLLLIATYTDSILISQESFTGIGVIIRNIPVLWTYLKALLWRHKERDGVSYHQPRDRLLNRLFRHRSKKTSKPRVTGLCVGNSPFDDVIVNIGSYITRIYHEQWCDHKQSTTTPRAYFMGSTAGLIYRGPVTHISVSIQPIISSNNDLSPVQSQAIIWTNTGLLLFGL